MSSRDSCCKTDFSIVTVVYNNAVYIKETMDSVINQGYRNIEYILIDGKSSDGTMEMIIDFIYSCATITLENQEKERIYLEATHNIYPTLTFKFLSEKDKGIYDAMNKGVALASKKWINFMNCGDRFYNLEVLQKVANKSIEHYDVVYGDTEIFYTDNCSYILCAKSNGHKFHHRFVHQSSFIKVHIMKKNPYDINFKIAGDTDFFTKIYNANYNFHKIELIISTFRLNGISSSFSWQMFYEDCKIGYRYNKLFPLYLSLVYVFFFIPKYILKTYLPPLLISWIYNLKK